MNKLILSIFICFVVFGARAQKKQFDDNIYFTPGKSIFAKKAAFVSSQSTDMDWIRYNLAQYHKQRKNAYLMQITGVALCGSSLLLKDDQPRNIMLTVGSAFSVSGFIALVFSEKHLKNASLPPPK